MELNSKQKDAAEYVGEAQNILVVAGAGCGKTKTIIARASYLIKSNIHPSRILLMAFTNRAAREIKARLRREVGAIGSQVFAGTFHSFCLKVMSKVPKSFGVSGLNIIDQDDQNSLMKLIRSKYISSKNREYPNAYNLLKYLSYSRNTCMNPEKYLRLHTDLNDHVIEFCCKLFKDYQKHKELRGYLDYDDLLELFSVTLKNKAKLRHAITSLFDEVLIDEMQDTNPLQFDILKHFSEEGTRLFCVGDPAQSIYGFRGAAFKHIYNFDKIFPNSIKLPLQLNYRSNQEILNLSNWLLERSPLDYQNYLIANRGASYQLPIVADFDYQQDEINWISEKILGHSEEGTSLNKIMVLVRSSTDARPIEADFIQRNIPYKFIGGTSLTKSAHVRDIFSLLRIARNPNDELAWIRFLELWHKVGSVTSGKIVTDILNTSTKQYKEILEKHLGLFHTAIKAYTDVIAQFSSPKNCVSTAVKYLEPILETKFDNWPYRKQDINLIVKVSERYKTVNDMIDAFTLEPMTTTELDKISGEEAVTIITIHSAKGTESDICFIPNAKQGTYPHSRSYGDLNDEEEERRVLYVAMTRAKNKLYVTRSTKTRSGFYMTNKPTIGEEYFLADIPDDLITKEVHGWRPTQLEGLSTLDDIY